MTTQIKTHLGPFIGAAPLDKIDRKMIDRFVAHMFGKTVGIDFASRFLVLRRSRTRGETLPTPKNRKGRHVPMTEPLAIALKAHRHLKGDLAFSQPDGSPLTLWHLHGALIRAARKAGLRTIRFHDLRHSYASILTKAGCPLRQVQEWFGHSTIQMTMRYSHLAPDDGREFLAVFTSSSEGNPAGNGSGTGN